MRIVQGELTASGRTAFWIKAAILRYKYFSGQIAVDPTGGLAYPLFTRYLKANRREGRAEHVRLGSVDNMSDAPIARRRYREQSLSMNTSGGVAVTLP